MGTWSSSLLCQKEHDGEQVTEEQVYKHIEARARKKYPEKYGRSGPPSPDSGGRQSNGKGSATDAGGKAFESLMANLPEDQQKAARHIVKLGLVTKEKYVEDYERMGR